MTMGKSKRQKMETLLVVGWKEVLKNVGLLSYRALSGGLLENQGNSKGHNAHTEWFY